MQREIFLCRISMYKLNMLRYVCKTWNENYFIRRNSICHVSPKCTPQLLMRGRSEMISNKCRNGMTSVAILGYTQTISNKCLVSSDSRGDIVCVCGIIIDILHRKSRCLLRRGPRSRVAPVSYIEIELDFYRKFPRVPLSFSIYSSNKRFFSSLGVKFR